MTGAAEDLAAARQQAATDLRASRQAARRLAELSAPVLGVEAEGIAEDLHGIHPAITVITAAFEDLAIYAHTGPAETADVLLALAGDGPNLTSLIAHLAAHLGDPATNPTLTTLPTDRQKTVRETTTQYALADTFNTPNHLITEAAAAIHGTA
jgi:hypothetical protein